MIRRAARAWRAIADAFSVLSILPAAMADGWKRSDAHETGEW